MSQGRIHGPIRAGLIRPQVQAQVGNGEGETIVVRLQLHVTIVHEEIQVKSHKYNRRKRVLNVHGRPFMVVGVPRILSGEDVKAHERQTPL